jgi:hypothetical protein
MDKISPLYIGIGVVALLIIAVLVRLLTRGRRRRPAIEFVNASSQNFFDTTVREVSLRTLFAGRGDPMVVQIKFDATLGFLTLWWKARPVRRPGFQGRRWVGDEQPM